MLSRSGQPAAPQALAWRSSGSGSATAKQRRVGVGSEAGLPAAGAVAGSGRLRWVGRERERLRERLTIDGRAAAATTVVRASLPAPQRLGFPHEAMGTEAVVRASIGFGEPSVRAGMPARPLRTRTESVHGPDDYSTKPPAADPDPVPGAGSRPRISACSGDFRHRRVVGSLLRGPTGGSQRSWRSVAATAETPSTARSSRRPGHATGSRARYVARRRQRRS